MKRFLCVSGLSLLSHSNAAIVAAKAFWLPACTQALQSQGGQLVLTVLQQDYMQFNSHKARHWLH